MNHLSLPLSYSLPLPPFMHFIIRGGEFRLPFLGKATTKVRVAQPKNLQCFSTCLTRPNGAVSTTGGPGLKFEFWKVKKSC